MKRFFAIPALFFVAATACSAENATASGNSTTPVTLTIGNTVLNATLNETKTAKELLSRLPVTVNLYNSGHDYCGDIGSLPYDKKDVQFGWKNGDLAFWTAGDDFVIFHADEEKSSNTGNIVVIGKVTDDIKKVRSLPSSIKVTIALAKQVAKNYRVKITAGSHEMIATFEDNATSRALVQRMPFTIPMENLYGREMCYRYGGGTFGTSKLRYDGYEIGDIAYWPPRGSLVILYKQNGEEFERQHIGKIDGDVGFFSTLGKTNVKFELVK